MVHDGAEANVSNAEAKSIISQVADGFNKISENNSIAEAKAIKQTQAIQEADTKDIINEANLEATNVLRRGAALGELDLNFLDEVYDSRTEEINAVNLAHDADVASISK